MGGGPRTFPGGVSKWQWKRSLVKKREDSEKRRLAREKMVYEMRQRAEVLAAHPELQQPWEKLMHFPPQDVTPQQHIASLVRRFEKPSEAEDLWDQRDGPQQDSTNGNPAPAAADMLCNARAPVQATTKSGPTRQKTDNTNKPKKKKEVSLIGKNMQDYLDSFDNDPLRVAADISTTSTSLKERHKDPFGLAPSRNTPSARFKQR